MLRTEALLRIGKEVGAPVSRVEATIALLHGGSTVPFIARYRKEATGNLNEGKIRDIQDSLAHYVRLEQRQQTILSSIEKQGKLTEELRQTILACFDRNELEDLYLPFKPKRKTRANAALERGLGPLADYIWAQAGAEPVEVYARQFVSPPEQAPESVEATDSKTQEAPKRVATVDEAIQGALHIVAERIAENALFRKQLRDKLLKEGVVRARVDPGKESQKTKYEMYYKFEETVPKIPSHRILAIRRGTRESILTYSVDIDVEAFIAALLPQVVQTPASQFAPLFERALRDGYERLLSPAIQNDVRSILRERAEAEAIHVFEDNLRTLLLAPPAAGIAIIGIDPDQKSRAKLAVVDHTGMFLENQTIHAPEPEKDLEGTERVLVDLIQKHNVRGIAIGNGAASREVEGVVRTILQKNRLNVFVVAVSEAGASVYSASKRAREEFPALDVSVRGAISIARRLQDPLAELVKVEPRFVGVGQYQHDVDQKRLRYCLMGAVECCVNRVGVDPNTASPDLLNYVSGLDETLTAKIVAYRTEHGVFRSRRDLLQIEGFSEKTFEQAAGFLRIRDAENPLDGSAVHPESYPLVERMAASVGVAVVDLIANPAHIGAIDFKTFETEAGNFTVADIREELLKPGRDPRSKFVAPRFREDVREVSDLKEGMELEGSVTNVTNFGAFVDLGVDQDGLVHISELSHRFIQDARDAVRVGDIVKVKVIGVESTMKRISLSMKAMMPKPKRPRPKNRVQDQPAPAAKTAPKKIAAEPTGVPAPHGARPVLSKPRRPASALHSQRKPPARAPSTTLEVTVPEVPAQSLEEKIRQLQEKFGRVG